MNAPSIKASPDGAYIQIHVTPSAKKDSISYVKGTLRIRTTQPADKNKANKDVIKILKPILGDCQITAGKTSRKKTIHVKNIGLDALNRILEGLS